MIVINNHHYPDHFQSLLMMHHYHCHHHHCHWPVKMESLSPLHLIKGFSLNDHQNKTGNSEEQKKLILEGRAYFSFPAAKKEDLITDIDIRWSSCWSRCCYWWWWIIINQYQEPLINLKSYFFADQTFLEPLQFPFFHFFLFSRPSSSIPTFVSDSWYWV